MSDYQFTLLTLVNEQISKKNLTSLQVKFTKLNSKVNSAFVPQKNNWQLLAEKVEGIVPKYLVDKFYQMSLKKRKLIVPLKLKRSLSQ